MSYTDNINALLKEREDFYSLLSDVKELVRKIRHDFLEDVSNFPVKFPCGTIALFWKGEGVAHISDPSSPRIKSCLKNAKASNVRIADWATATRSQIEQDLWSLWITQTISGGKSLDEWMLSAGLDALERLQSSLLWLMRWLFPEIKERLDIVEAMAAHGDFSTWPVRDQMLFWIVYMRDTNSGQEKVRDVTDHILGLQEKLSLFGHQNEDLAASAGGLLALISCARKSVSESNLGIDTVRQAVRWIAGHITKAKGKDAAWAYYALCEYIDFELSTIKR